VADRVDAAVNDEDASGPHPAVELGFGEAESEELAPVGGAVLAFE